MPPRYVAGLDLSLTSTGMCALDVDTGEVFLRNITSKGKMTDTVAQTAQRISAIVGRVSAGVVKVEPILVVIESLNFNAGRHDSSAIRRGGLWWGVASRLTELGFPIAVATPAQMHKFASGKYVTGAGQAKDRTLVAAAKQWPEQDITLNDLADAAWLAAMGAYRLGCPTVPVTGYRDDTAAKLAWPTEGIALAHDHLVALA